MKKNKKNKGKILLSFLAITLTTLSFFGVSNLMAKAEDNNTPEHHKRLTSKGDGTYELALDVTGSSEHEHIVASNVNVVIVYDHSSSMASKVSGGTNTRADQAEDVVYNFVHNLFGYQNTSKKENIQVSLVTFAKTGSVVENWTSTESDIIQHFDKGGSDGTTKQNYSSTNANNGTNWESALDQANTLLKKADSDPTFVILITDGAPTASGNGDNAINPTGASLQKLTPFYSAALKNARSIQTRANTTLYGIYAYGTEADLLDDLMYYANTGSERTISTQTDRTDNYFNTSNTEALQTAVDEIFEHVVQAMGVSSVTIKDGTTSAVKASTQTVNLLKVDESSYKYWLSMIVTSEGNNYVNEETGSKITFTKNSDNTYTGIWNDKDGNHEIKGTIEINPNDKNLKENEQRKIFKMEWTEANELQNQAAPEASLVTDENGSKSVDWDLSSVGVLLNGVTYTVTFDVWPTQYTYDLIADLENGKVKYSSLDSSATSSKYAGLKQYISYNEVTGEYFLKTNTTAELAYKDTRETNPQMHKTEYKNPDPVETNVDEISITKKWENDFDNASIAQTQITVNRNTKSGTEEFYKATLDFNNNKETGIKIATGLMRLKENNDGTGEIEVLDEGHDYTFGELSNDYYKWELISETVHPMLINGKLKELVLLDDAVTKIHKIGETIDSKYVAPEEMKTNDYYNNGENEYIKLNGKVYLITKTTHPIIDAINYRRSNLNILKVVNGEAADPDEQFELNITVKDPGLSSDEYIWFSVRENDQTIKDLSNMITSDGWTTESNGSGYYYAKSGTTLSIKLKVGQNLRFTNLTTKATYEITENDKNNFVFTDANGSAIYGKDEEAIDYVKGQDYKVEKEGNKVTKVTGGITLTNSTYSVKIENTYDFAGVGIIKKWEDHNNRDGLRDNIKIQVKQDGSNFGNPITITNNSVSATNQNEWNYTITSVMINGKETKLPRYKVDGTEYKYTIAEESLDNYTSTRGEEIKGKGKVTYTLINTHLSKTEVKATKVWNDANNQDGKRQDVTFKLYKKVGNTETPIEGTEKTISKDATGEDLTVTWTNLDVFDKDDTEIIYTVKETTTLSGYETPIVEKNSNKGNSFTVTNTHKPETVSVSATKNWDDANNQDGKRQDVTFRVCIKNGDKCDDVEGVKTKTISKDATGDDLTVTWAGLDKYKNGSEIKYNVEEVTTIDGYKTPVVTETAKNVFVITNTHERETKSVKATKVWNDNDNQDGKRQDVTFKLCIKNGDKCDEIEGTEKTISKDATGDDLTVTWTGLDKYKNRSEINYIVEEVTKIDGYETKATETKDKGFTITNTHKPETISVSATKNWDDVNNVDGKRQDVTFKICIKNGNKCDDVAGAKTKTISKDATGNDLTVTWTGLNKYKNGKEIKYNVEEVTTVSGYKTPFVTETAKNKFLITNTHERETTSIKATKVWDDRKNQDGKRQDVTFKICIKNGDNCDDVEGVKTKTISKDATGDDLTVIWDGLYKYENGKEINYTVKEITTIKGYDAKVTGNKETGFTVTNSYTPETTSVSATKVWDDANNQDGKRQNITLKLYKKTGNQETPIENSEKTISKDATGDDLTVTWTGIDKYENAKEINYIVKETTAITGYNTNVTGNKEEGFTVINSHTPEKTSVKATKVWDDANNIDGKRQDVTFKLCIQNGDNCDDVEGAQPLTISKNATGEGLTATWTNLDKYKNGSKINYTVKETTQIPGYKEPVTTGNMDSGFIIINSYVPGTTNIKITKKWVNVSEDGITNIYGHDNKIEVQLSCTSSKADYCTNKKYTLTEANNWTVTDSELPKYRDGELLTYNVTEITKVKNYDSTTKTIETIADLADKNTYEAEITNIYKPNPITISGQKHWEDDNNNDVVRPESITINLYDGITKNADGSNAIIKTTTATANEWKYSFDKLPETDNNGNKINYYVDEVIDGNSYTKEVNEENFDITNYHLSETVTFTVTKHWEDQDNFEGLRPESITVTLSADGEVIKTVILSEENNWTYTFDNEGEGYKKYKNVDGEKITINYTLEEEKNINYEETTTTTIGSPITQEVAVNDKTNVPQTNTNTDYDIKAKRDIEYTSISGEKTWNDNNNADGIRPDYIYLDLYGNNTFIQTIKVGAENNWKYVVDGLYKYQNGKKITYTIKEKYVDGYTCVIDGFNITNTHQVKKYAVEVLPPKTGAEKTNNYFFLVVLIGNIIGISIETTVKKLKKATI